MHFIKFLVILSIWPCVDSVFTCSTQRHIVCTRYGPVTGQSQVARSGREFKAFKGIPYAKPPVGPLRFKAPVAPDIWQNPIDGTKDRKPCIQKNYLFNATPPVEGVEDCLYLNVYVPETYRNQLLPVMVFIHWGGFIAGRASSDYLGPEFLMNKDIILVTFNYRLGVFGFFSTLDDAAPGNFALKDQVLALKFVQENIEYFGGDKNRVTIFGQSAGAGSVSLHLVSPLSKGLFHRAISQSGVALNLWARPFNQLQPLVVDALSQMTGCAGHKGNSVNLVNCLRAVDANALANTADLFKFFYSEPLTPYTVVTEVKSQANPEPFLTEDPLESFLAGRFSKVPYIVGNVENEGVIRAAPLVLNAATLEVLNNRFAELLPKMLFLEVSSPYNSNSLLQNITNFYLGGKKNIDRANSESVRGFLNLYSDRAFYYGTYQAVILQSRQGHKPIWVYNFNYKGANTFGDKFAAASNDINFNWGVSHCDDLLYLFKSPGLFRDQTDKTDVEVSNTLVTLWTNFAMAGDPDPFRNFKWKSLDFADGDVENSKINILHVEGSSASCTTEYTIRNGFSSKRVEFWRSQNLTENFPGLK